MTLFLPKDPMYYLDIDFINVIIYIILIIL